MEDEILDFEERKEISKHAARSVKLLLFNLAFYVIFILISILIAFEGDWFIYLMVGIPIIVFIASVIGLINGIKSIFKKEDSIFLKCIGTMGNTILVVVVGHRLVTGAYFFYRFSYG